MALLRDKESKVIREVHERYVKRWPDDYEAPTKKDLEEYGVADVDAAYESARTLIGAPVPVPKKSAPARRKSAPKKTSATAKPVAPTQTTTVETNQSAGGTEGGDA